MYSLNNGKSATPAFRQQHPLIRDLMYTTTLEDISVKTCTLDPKVNKL